MAKITYHTHDNKTHTIDVQNGLTMLYSKVQINLDDFTWVNNYSQSTIKKQRT